VELPDILPRAIALLVVTIGPVEAAAVFLAVTHGMDGPERNRTGLLACAIGFFTLVACALVGAPLLNLLRISMPAFRAAGGVLLLKLAADLLLEHRSELSSINQDEELEARHHASVAVFPLAIPMIAGPGSITGVIILMTEAGGTLEQAAVLLAIAVVMSLTLFCVRGAQVVTQRLGIMGANILARISGMLLAALAMQLVFDGVKESGIFS
jgi:multiple antibiotic resistance protein